MSQGKRKGKMSFNTGTQWRYRNIQRKQIGMPKFQGWVGVGSCDFPLVHIKLDQRLKFLLKLYFIDRKRSRVLSIKPLGLESIEFRVADLEGKRLTEIKEKLHCK